jgi:D-alanine-D-alanine ligase
MNRGRVEKIPPNVFGRVAVLMGGTSSEREVSLMSGQNVLEALQRKGVDAYSIDQGLDIIGKLQTNKPDRVFIALHGTNGEDGVIQGLLEILHIPYTSSGVIASALTMNKYRSKLFWKSLGLPVLPLVILNEKDDIAEFVKQFGFPLCVKPINSGSSLGVSKIISIAQLPKAYDLAKQYGSQVMVEPWIEGREFDVCILGNEALPIVEIIPPQGSFFDYKAKYFSDKTKYICPCNLSGEEQDQLQTMALKAFHASDCRYWSRIEFLQDKNGKFWLSEINTIPGLTLHSIVPLAAKQSGINFDDLIYKILGFTLEK